MIRYTLFLIPLLLAFGIQKPLSQNELKKIPLDSDAVTIVELFTSQGCSSCPAADRLLHETTLRAEKDGQPVIGLSFHVSYWNYLGWKDPYSSEAYTERQRKYGRVMGLSSIYTPQMIVNGSTEFVGSHKAKLQQSIAEGLKRDVNTQIQAKVLEVAGRYEIEYDLKGTQKNALLNVALVQKHVENFVPRGENGGRKLQHDNVVRSFKTFPARAEGTVGLPIPEGFDFQKGFAVLFVQDKVNMKIATAVKLSQSQK